MSLQLILGSSGAGKTHALLTEILQLANEHANEKFLVIVPEQFTMQTQKELISMHPRGGILNVDVLSFERLAYRVFDEVGGVQAELIEEIGKSFILEKIALDEEKNLPAFGKRLQKSGSIEEMKSVISELTQYDISPEKLRAVAGGTDTGGSPGDSGSTGGTAGTESAAGNGISPALAAKLRDISAIYEDFRRFLEGKKTTRSVLPVFFPASMTAEEVPDALCRIADRSELLKGSTLAFDGFTGFTPIQTKLIRCLLPLAKKIYVTVTFDAELDPSRRLRETDLFHMSSVMIGSLKQLTAETGVPMEMNHLIRDEGKGRFRSSQALSFLEKNLFRYGGSSYPEKCSDIHIFEAQNPRGEMNYVSAAIARLVRTEGLRYRDFAVLTGDLDSYKDEARRAFAEEGIPCFIDEKRNLSGNPFVEYLRAAIEACTESYSYDSLFRMLKTGMTNLSEDEIDRLENYVLAMGIRGKKRWRTKWTRPYRNENPAELLQIDRSREKVADLLDGLSDALAKKGSTVREKTEALYHFCVQSNIQQKLKISEEAFDREGRPDLAREYAQVYGRIMHLLDKLVDVLGEEKISMSDYRQILEAGLTSEKIGIIPPGTDQVAVGDMERSRLSDVRILFFVGMNEGLIPKPAVSGGVLSEADRVSLAGQKIGLKPNPREEMLIQRFYLYLSLTKPSDQLFLTCSLSDSAGAVLRPASVLRTIRTLFPEREEKTTGTEKVVFLKKTTGTEKVVFSKKTTGTEKVVFSGIERPQDGIRIIADGLRKIREEEPSPAWLELFTWYLRRPEYAERLRLLMDAAGKMSENEEIGRAAAEALYGRNLRNSATRLEIFSACAFRHFAQYGLRLAKREEFEFTGLDRGNIIHSALQLFVQNTEGKGRSWADLSDAERTDLVGKCMAEAVSAYPIPILEDSARSGYEEERMRRLMASSVKAMQEQLQAGDFRPSQAEQSFSLGERFLEASEFDLGDLGTLSLTGRIDRIDTCSDGGRELVKIIDYKTGMEKFDMTEVYYGLQLQLIIYLNAALEITEMQGKTAEPAGIFYSEIKDPILKSDQILTEEERKRQLLRALKGSGCVSADRGVISRLDRTLSADHTSSDVIPVSLKKDGTLAKTGTNALEPEDFRLVMDYVNRKVREIGKKILEGDVSVNPYQYGDDTACSFCPYRSVCGFDLQTPGCAYRRLDKLDTEEALEKMKEKDH